MPPALHSQSCPLSPRLRMLPTSSERARSTQMLSPSLVLLGGTTTGFMSPIRWPPLVTLMPPHLLATARRSSAHVSSIDAVVIALAVVGSWPTLGGPPRPLRRSHVVSLPSSSTRRVCRSRRTRMGLGRCRAGVGGGARQSPAAQCCRTSSASALTALPVTMFAPTALFPSKCFNCKGEEHQERNCPFPLAAGRW